MNAAEELLVEVQVREACELAGHPELASEIVIVWSSRLTRTLGKASCLTSEITLAAKAWPLLDAEERRDTVFHEVAHLVAFHEVGAKGWGHGSKWRRVMRRIGASPKRYAAAAAARAIAPIRRKVTRCIASCRCIESRHIPRARAANGYHLVTPRTGAKIRTGARFICQQCGTALELTGGEVKV